VEAASGATTKAAEAQAQKTVLHAQARKALMVSAAVSLVVLTVGIAGWLILSALPDRVFDTTAVTPDLAPTPPTPASVPNWPPVSVPAPNPQDIGVITTNFSLFREKVVSIRNKEYLVSAGHNFASETDTMFTRAWCYTRASADGLILEIGLGDLEPNKPAAIDMPSSEMLTKSGLSRSNIQTLFANCPWLDGNPNVQSNARAESLYQFTGEVTANSVDQLIAAISTGAIVVEFSSPGGLIGEAVRGFNAIRAAGVKTVATGDCSSACTLMFLGGADRSVSISGKIGVHQWRSEDGQAADFDTQMMSAMLVSLTSSVGVSEEFIIAGARTPTSGMYYLTRAELSNWGVVTKTL